MAICPSSPQSTEQTPRLSNCPPVRPDLSLILHPISTLHLRSLSHSFSQSSHSFVALCTVPLPLPALSFYSFPRIHAGDCSAFALALALWVTPLRGEVVLHVIRSWLLKLRRLSSAQFLGLITVRRENIESMSNLTNMWWVAVAQTPHEITSSKWFWLWKRFLSCCQSIYK